jgi:hypothetical protein
LIQTGSDEEEKRDIGTLALRAVLTEMPPSSPVAGDVVDKSVNNIIKQLSSVRVFSHLRRRYSADDDSFFHVTFPQTNTA